MIWFVIAVFLIILATAAVNEHQKQKTLRYIAKKIEFELVGTRRSRLLLSDLKIAEERGAIGNLMRGARDEIEIEFFEYTLGMGMGTTITAIAAFGSYKLDLPSFELKPWKLFGPAMSRFGWQDINSISQRRFFEKFVLKGDEGLLEAVFTYEVMDYLVARPKISVEGRGRTFLYFRRDSRVRPQEIPSFLGEGLTLARLFVRQTDQSS